MPDEEKGGFFNRSQNTEKRRAEKKEKKNAYTINKVAKLPLTEHKRIKFISSQFFLLFIQ